MTNRKLYLIVLLVFIFGCKQKSPDMELIKEVIKKTDIEFSNYSVEHGVNAAFIKYADNEAVLLKPNSMPIVGNEAIIEYQNNVNDKNIQLTWKPEFAKVAKSGDLGYTYGFWELQVKGDSVIRKGTYLSIWKKQDDGSWKYVLDTGNSGLGD